MATCLGLFAGIIAGLTSKSADAAAPDHLNKTAVFTQDTSNEYFHISEIFGTKTLYLYNNGSDNGISLMEQAFSYYNTNATDRTDLYVTSANELVHRARDTRSIPLYPSSALKHDGEFASKITLSNNIVVALSNKQIRILAQAETTSAKETGFGLTSDKYDYVQTKLYLYNAADRTVKQTKAAQKENYSIDKVAFKTAEDLNEINGKNYDTVELVFSVELEGNICNYLGVRYPEITFETDDTAAPSITATKVGNSWTNSRAINLSVSDENGSGIYKVDVYKEVSTDEEGNPVYAFYETAFDLASSLNYQTKYDFTYALKENGNFKFVAYDNVGNVSDFTDVIEEDHIDTSTPALSAIHMNTKYTENDRFLFLNKTISFDVENFVNNNISDLDNGSKKYDSAVSPAHLSYTYTYTSFSNNESITSDEVIFYSTEESGGFDYLSNIEAPVDLEGFYTFTFYAYDDAGNRMKVDAINLLVREPSKLEVTLGENKFTYDGLIHEFEFDVPVIDKNSVLVKYYIVDVNGQRHEVDHPVNAGDYVAKLFYEDISYSVDDEFYFTIEKKAAIVMFQNQSITYGEDIDFSKVYISGLISQDEYIILNIKDYMLCEYLITKAAGTFEIKADEEALGNYKLSTNIASLNVSPAKLRIVAHDQSKTYGEADPTLTLDVYGKVFDNESINIVLTYGEFRDVGEYKLYIDEALSDYANYIIDVENSYFGTLTINKSNITVIADSISKGYGQADPAFTYSVSGNLYDDIVFMLSRTNISEDIGAYEIIIAEQDLKNYNISYISGVLSIEKSWLKVVIDSTTKPYGEDVPQLTYKVYGMFNGEEYELSSDDFEISIVCDANRFSSVGDYKIVLGNFNYNSDNYIFNNENVQEGTLAIIPAVIEFNIEDQAVIYTGSEIDIKEQLGLDFNVRIVYLDYYDHSIEISSIIYAGSYSFYIVVEDDNYIAFTSNIATLTVKKQLVSIVITQSTFIYNGQSQVPLYTTNVEGVVLMPIFEIGYYPYEIGEYKYTLVSNSENHECRFQGVLRIVSEFYAENNGGDASIGTGNVAYVDSNIEIYENRALLSTFSALRDGLRCVTAYGFRNISNYNVGDVFTFKIKALKTKGAVKIYSIDASGNITELAYTIRDGYYVLSINDLSVSILVANTDNTMIIARIATIAFAIIVCATVTSMVNRYRRNKFYRKYTTFKNLDNELIKSSNEIINARIIKKRVSASEFLKK